MARTPFTMSRVRVLIGAWGRIVGRVALRRALPTYAVLFVAAGVCFVGAQAMRPSELTGAMSASWQGRVGGFLVWCLLSWPVARAVLLAPTLAFLRGLALPSWAMGLAGALWSFAVQAPWMLLWAAGAGPVAGLAAGGVAAALHAAWAGGLGRSRRSRAVWLGEGLALASCGLAAASFGAGPRGPAALSASFFAGCLLLALPAWTLGLYRVIGEGGAAASVTTDEGRPRARSSWGPRARAGGAPVGHSPVLAWARTLVRVLVRGQGGLVLRWLWWGLAVATAMVLTARNNGAAGDRQLARRLAWAFISSGALVGALGPAAALARCEHASAWWLEALALSRRRRVLAQLLALAPFAAVIAMAQGAAFFFLVESAAASSFSRGAGGAVAAAGLAAVFAAVMAALSGTAAALALRGAAEQGDGRDGGRLVVWGLVGAGVEAAAGFRGGGLGLLLATSCLVAVAVLVSIGRARRQVLVTAGGREP